MSLVRPAICLGSPHMGARLEQQSEALRAFDNMMGLDLSALSIDGSQQNGPAVRARVLT